MSTLPTINAENTDLETHVELCAQRYQALDDRLASVESTVTALYQKVESLHVDLWRVLIGTMGTVAVSVITTIGVVITHLK
jgi:hypothetical protein